MPCRDVDREQAARLLASGAGQRPSRSTRSGSAPSAPTPFRIWPTRSPWDGAVRFGAGSRRHPVRGRGLGRGEPETNCRRRQRQPHAGRRRMSHGARQERRRRVRLRASPHRRQGAQGQEVHRLAQHHDALHADHLGRQGAGPRTRSSAAICDAMGKAIRKVRRPGAGASYRRRTSCSTISTR